MKMNELKKKNEEKMKIEKEKERERERATAKKRQMVSKNLSNITLKIVLCSKRN